jgi:hypothetical protein
MFPYERSLVKRLEGKPFVLVGVNGDDNDPDLKSKNEKQQITWRSFRNARKDRPSVSDEWNVEGWPTLHLIDHKGILRKKWLLEKEIDEAVNELVKEAEKVRSN